MSNDRAVVPVDSNVFLTFDRLDDDQIVAEMKGAALNAYVYEFTEGGQTVRGLSKTGTDDAARIMAVKYGEALREVDCWLEREDEEAAYFKAKVSRFVTRDDGTSIEMDSAIGHKRQPKQVTLKGGFKKANPFWYEQGGQKALRNAKQKLMPETIKQAIIAMYVSSGKMQKVKPEFERRAEPPQTAINGASRSANVNTETGEIVEGVAATSPNVALGPMTLAQRKRIWATAHDGLGWEKAKLEELAVGTFDGKELTALNREEADQLSGLLAEMMDQAAKGATA